jgi:hypothetical protein
MDLKLEVVDLIVVKILTIIVVEIAQLRETTCVTQLQEEVLSQQIKIHKSVPSPIPAKPSSNF